MKIIYDLCDGKKYRVTKELLDELKGCSPNSFMNNMNNLKFITLVDHCSEQNVHNTYSYQKLSFKEIEQGPWNYTLGFVKILLDIDKNSSSMEIE